MAAKNMLDIARLWVAQLSDAAGANLYQDFHVTANLNQAPTDVAEWASKNPKYATEIKKWWDKNQKEDADRARASKAMAQTILNTASSTAPVPTSPDGQSQVGSAFGSSSAIPPPTPNYPLPANYPQVPQAMRGMLGGAFNPTAPAAPRGGVGAPTGGTPAQPIVGAAFNPPPSPAPATAANPAATPYQSPRQWAPNLNTPSAMAQQQAAAQANMALQYQRQKDEQEKQKRFQEYATRQEFAEAGLWGKGQMIMGGKMAGMGGMLGKAAGGAGMALEGAEKTVQLANAMADMTRTFKMSSLAANPLEQGKMRGEALGQIPVIGGLLKGLNELGLQSWKTHYQLREMTDSMLRGSFQIGQYSGNMKMVEAEKNVREIQLSQKRGDDLAGSTNMLMQMEMDFKERNQVWENPMEREKQSKAMEELVKESSKVEYRQLDKLMGDRSISDEEMARRKKEIEDREKEQLKEIEEYKTTGKVPDKYKKGMMDYGDTLGGWMDNVRKNTMANRGRPDRFGGNRDRG